MGLSGGRTRGRKRKKEEHHREGKSKQDFGNEALNFIDYEKHNMTFVQEDVIPLDGWNKIDIHTLKFDNYQPFIAMLLQQKKNEYLIWMLKKIQIYNQTPFTKQSNYTSIWLGSGSPYVDYLPNVQDKETTASFQRIITVLNKPTSVGAAKFDRLAEYTAERKKTVQLWYPPCKAMDSDKRSTDIFWGANSGECFVLNEFKNMVDPRTSFFATWERNTGGFIMPNQAFPADRAALEKACGYPAQSSFQSTRSPWLSCQTNARYYPIAGEEDAFPCLDDPFNVQMYLATNACRHYGVNAAHVMKTEPKIQTLSEWHLAKVGMKSLSAILEQMLFKYLKQHHWNIPTVPPRAVFDGTLSPLLEGMEPFAAEACINLMQDPDFDIYTFVQFMKEGKGSEVPMIGNAELLLSPDHPMMKMMLPSERSRKMMFQVSVSY